MSSIITSSDNITVVRWMDGGPVHTISTYAGISPEDEAPRWDKSKKKSCSAASLQHSAVQHVHGGS